jgi:hypothetical protein
MKSTRDAESFGCGRHGDLLAALTFPAPVLGHIDDFVRYRTSWPASSGKKILNFTSVIIQIVRYSIASGGRLQWLMQAHLPTPIVK